MLTAISVLLAAGGIAVLTSYAMWRACNRSGLAAMVAGVIFGLLAFLGAILIGWLMTRGLLG
jgi:hypothetical protein